MTSNKQFLMSDIYDYLMENNFTIGTNIKDEFKDTYIDCAKGIIYLRGSDTLPDFKLTIMEA